MMRMLLAGTLFLFAAFTGQSQVYIDGENINADSTVSLIEIVHTTHPKLFSVDYIDIGGKNNWRTKFTDANGKRMHFNSGVHLMNYMKQQGWSMVRRDIVFQAQRDAVSGGNTLVFLLYEKTK